MTEIVTTEIFGVPVDFAIEQTTNGDTCTIAVSAVLPGIGFGKTADGSPILAVWAPPRMKKPISDSEMRLMRLAGFL